jgi:hypothetical protein
MKSGPVNLRPTPRDFHVLDWFVQATLERAQFLVGQGLLTPRAYKRVRTELAKELRRVVDNGKLWGAVTRPTRPR